MQKAPLNGILLIDKPNGITSFDVIRQLRKILCFKKIGHSGTLDSFATGVLIILLGKATKLARFVNTASKEYVAELFLGIQTDTGDISGQVVKKSEKKCFLPPDLKQKVLNMTCQIPPKYSCIKINGQRAYKLALGKVDFKMTSRDISVYDFEILNFSNKLLTYKVKVSKGTYIRTMSQDIANLMGTIGTTKTLVRTECAGFSLDECVSLASLNQSNIYKYILPVDAILKKMQTIHLDAKESKLFGNGGRIRGENLKNDFAKVYNKDHLLGIAIVEQQIIRPKIVF